MRASLLGLRILLWRSRPVLVACLAVVIALAVARQMAPPPEGTRPVVVTARAIAVATQLAAADVRVARVPPRLVPDEAVTDPALPVGRTTAVALPRGVPVVPSMLDDGRFGWTAPSGTVTVPVRLVDPAVAALLRPGDRIDLVAPGHDLDGGTAVVVARGALVLEVILSTGGSVLGGLADPDALTVVAVSADEGHRLSGSDWGSLGAVLVEGS